MTNEYLYDIIGGVTIEYVHVGKMAGNKKKPKPIIKGTSTDPDGLSEKERLFLDAYTTNGFDRANAVKKAGYSPKGASTTGAEILNRPHVIKALGKELDKRRNKFFVNEQDVLEGLYREASLDKDDGGTQQGRIQAWTSIGRALGMFDQKVKDLEKKASRGGSGGTQIQIINYNQGTSPTEKPVNEIKQEAAAALESVTQTDEEEISDNGE